MSDPNTELLDRRIDERLKKVAKNDGGDNNGGMDDAWKQSVEARLGQLHSDLRLGAAGLGALLFAILGLYIWTGNKTDGMNEKISKLSEKSAVIEVRSQHLEQVANSIDKKIGDLDHKVDGRLDTINNKIDRILQSEEGGAE